MRAYFDSSGDLSSDFLVLTGVAAREFVWNGFEQKWPRVLADREPPAPYVHMRELVSGQEPFSNSSGWDEARRNKLIADCLMYVQHLDKQGFRTFTCTVDMVAYRERLQRYPLPDPHDICSHFCPDLVVEWFFRESDIWFGQNLVLHFDRNERHKGVFQRRLRQRKRLTEMVRNTSHHIVIGESKDSRKCYQLQLADLIAWAHNRKLTDGRTWQHLAMMCETVLPFTRKEIGPTEVDILSAYSILSPDRLGEFV